MVSRGDDVAWLGRAARPGEVWATGMGDDPAVASARPAPLREQPSTGSPSASPRSPCCPSRCAVPDPGTGASGSRSRRPDAPRHSAVDLALDDPRIAPLLEHSDSAYLFPGDPASSAGRECRRGPLSPWPGGGATGAAHLQRVHRSRVAAAAGRRGLPGIMHGAWPTVRRCWCSRCTPPTTPVVGPTGAGIRGGRPVPLPGCCAAPQPPR